MIKRLLITVGGALISTALSAQCLLERSDLLGRSIERLPQLLEQERIGFESGVELREVPAEQLCPNHSQWDAVDVALLFVEKRLARVTLQQMGELPKLEAWVQQLLNEGQRAQLAPSESWDQRHHFVVDRGNSVVRYQRSPIAGSGVIIESVEISHPPSMRRRAAAQLRRELEP
jgi:hypothetical protein